jgi:hypothetical protein
VKFFLRKLIKKIYKLGFSYSNKMVKIVLPKKVAYSLLSIFILVVAAVGVYAWNGTSPSTLGHTMSEIRPSCSGMLVSSGSDNTWTCIPNPPSCTGTNVLHYSASTNNWYCNSI